MAGNSQSFKGCINLDASWLLNMAAKYGCGLRGHAALSLRTEINW